MSQADDVFVKNFLAVLAALIVFTIAAFFLARAVGFGAEEQIQSSPQAVAERIKPIGQVRTVKPGEEPPPLETETVAATAAGTPASTEKTGEEIYNSTCVACHATGAAGAPKLDDKQAWTTRAEQGLTVLVEHAVNGKGVMPPKGGNAALTPEDIERAVQYMLSQAGVSAN